MRSQLFGHLVNIKQSLSSEHGKDYSLQSNNEIWLTE